MPRHVVILAPFKACSSTPLVRPVGTGCLPGAWGAWEILRGAAELGCLGFLSREIPEDFSLNSCEWKQVYVHCQLLVWDPKVPYDAAKKACSFHGDINRCLSVGPSSSPWSQQNNETLQFSMEAFMLNNVMEEGETLKDWLAVVLAISCITLLLVLILLTLRNVFKTFPLSCPLGWLGNTLRAGPGQARH
ncbi:hypothetical protein CB1_000760009 [Camelus ferus]|nr:hypothetical protein CB1_000760009 [Camelus ferus]